MRQAGLCRGGEAGRGAHGAWLRWGPVAVAAGTMDRKLERGGSETCCGGEGAWAPWRAAGRLREALFLWPLCACSIPADPAPGTLQPCA